MLCQRIKSKLLSIKLLVLEKMRLIMKRLYTRVMVLVVLQFIAKH